MLEMLNKAKALVQELKEKHNIRCLVIMAENESEHHIISAIDAMLLAHANVVKSLTTIEAK